MAFKSFSQYQEDKNGEFFVLPNDNDYADVVFLYRSPEDVLVADVHYLSTASYKGYAHCCGTGCPACAYTSPRDGKIHIQHKLFIPLYNMQKGKIEFWDRSTFFEQILQKYVFDGFPNPSEAVFRITRHGEAGSRDTKYEIVPIGRNSSMPYEKILADCGVTLPDYYSVICKEMSAKEMSEALYSTVSTSNLQEYGYTPVPRGTAAAQAEEMPTVSTPVYSAPPEMVPPLPDYVPGAEPQVPSGVSMEAIDIPEDDSEDSLDDVKF